MDTKQLEQYFIDTAYIRTGGSPEERKAAEYLAAQVEKLGFKAELQSFEVPMAEIEQAELWVETPQTGRCFPLSAIFLYLKKFP